MFSFLDLSFSKPLLLERINFRFVLRNYLLFGDFADRRFRWPFGLGEWLIARIVRADLLRSCF